MYLKRYKIISILNFLQISDSECEFGRHAPSCESFEVLHFQHRLRWLIQPNILVSFVLKRIKEEEHKKEKEFEDYRDKKNGRKIYIL